MIDARRPRTRPSRFAVLVVSAIATLCVAIGSADAASVRIKDIVDVQGVRGNDLVGYGLVVGLNGTGDSLRSIPFTEDSLINLLERLGVNIEGEDVQAKNVAAVIVTATLPPFARAGSEIDATVSAIGDAKNLLGGTLVLTPLLAADGNVYAVAQGTIIAGGFEASGVAESVTRGVPTAGVVASGAGSSARSSSLSTSCARSASRCATLTSPQRSASRARSIAKSDWRLPGFWTPAPSTSRCPACSRTGSHPSSARSRTFR
jgi:hypothetical protein